jgi:hypothetical protein
MLRSLHRMPISDAKPGGRVNRDDERWRLVEQLLASPFFSRSPRLSSFLLYICERSLEGRAADLNERLIGMHVFGRHPTYNPGDDSIVRSQARLLRGRLEQYFQTTGTNSEWRLSVPKGSYVPVFERCRPASLEKEQSSQEEGQPPRVKDPAQLRAEIEEAESVEQDGTAGQGWLWMGIAISALLLLALGVYQYTSSLHRGPGNHRVHRLWAAMFDPNLPTVIVPADSMLALIEGRAESPVSLSDYLKHKYPDLPAGTPLKMNDYQFTSIADLKMAVRLARLPEAARGLLEVKYARDLTLNDAKQTNMILIGGVRSNPWVQLFTGRINFLVGSDRVINNLPRPGEPASYSLELRSSSPRSFGIIAFLPGLDSEGHTLLVEGSDMAGTESACDFLFDDAAFDAFADRIRKSNGDLPYFEALLAATTLNGNASHSQVLAYHLIS